MTTSTTIEVVGIKEALAHVNKLDKKLRRQITKDFKEIMSPVLYDAHQDVPGKPPMSGWARGYRPKQGNNAILPWSGTEAQQLNSFVSGKRPKQAGGRTRNLAAFGLRWRSRDAVLFDATGQYNTKQGAQMLSVLNQRFGAPSRVMWRAYEASAPQVQDKMLALVRHIMQQTTRQIGDNKKAAD